MHGAGCEQTRRAPCAAFTVRHASGEGVAGPARAEHELRAKGVTGLVLFGSTARGEGGSASDVDLVLELSDSSALGLLDLIDLKETLAEELGRPVDIAFRSRLRPWFAARIAPDLVRVF